MYQTLSSKKTVTVIIPAYNERNTISSLVEIVRSHPDVEEVIVVDDGSGDDTARLAQEAGARVIRHARNRGKATAMDNGVNEAKTDILFFIDGDVFGITHEMMSTALWQVMNYKADMYALIVDRGNYIPAWLVRMLPLLSGIRVMRKEIWKTVPQKFKNYFQIELALNYFVSRNGLLTSSEVMPGLHHVVKEKKRGVLWGMYQRAFMIRDIIFVLIKLQVAERAKSSLRLVTFKKK
ncbi:MAG: hypothetical protein RL094_812 [Candidatus Parcubacteria bacterium]|jgi:glycosyltransferase involved in cell wall biosynthesis